MLRLPGFSLILPLAFVAIGYAQEKCTVTGFDKPRNATEVSIAQGVIADGNLKTDAVLYRPMSARHPSPPVMFSHSDIKTADIQADLRAMAVKLARRGATVLVLERTVLLESSDALANPDPRLPDCASRWLLSRENLDVLHATYMGPRFRQSSGRPPFGRFPLGFENLKQRRGLLYVPLAEPYGGLDTIRLTTPEGQRDTVQSIETHWSVQVDR